MSDAAPLGDRGTLEWLFNELGGELLALDARAEMVMVGGSWLLWHTQRAATWDVDSAVDSVLLWPECGFIDAMSAAEAFRSAYPHAPEDPHLVEYITGIATDARTS